LLDTVYFAQVPAEILLIRISFDNVTPISMTQFEVRVNDIT